MTLEADIQIACNLFLEKASNIYDFRHFHVPNEGVRRPQYRAKLKKMGLRSGCPDLIIEYYPAKIIYVELKNEKGKLSETQKLWQIQSNHFNTPHYVLKGDIQQCIEQLKLIILKYVPLRKSLRTLIRDTKKPRRAR
jgi:hypothetical protein